jgi:hypothetical protein
MRVHSHIHAGASALRTLFSDRGPPPALPAAASLSLALAAIFGLAFLAARRYLAAPDGLQAIAIGASALFGTLGAGLLLVRNRPIECTLQDLRKRLALSAPNWTLRQAVERARSLEAQGDALDQRSGAGRTRDANDAFCALAGRAVTDGAEARRSLADARGQAEAA